MQYFSKCAQAKKGALTLLLCPPPRTQYHSRVHTAQCNGTALGAHHQALVRWTRAHSACVVHSCFLVCFCVQCACIRHSFCTVPHGTVLVWHWEDNSFLNVEKKIHIEKFPLDKGMFMEEEEDGKWVQIFCIEWGANFDLHVLFTAILYFVEFYLKVISDLVWLLYLRFTYILAIFRLLVLKVK